MLQDDVIRAAIPHTVRETDLAVGERTRGKVRDIYRAGDRRYLVATDRLSAFDRIITAVPFKGQVLNQLATWWFRQTADVADNHVIDVPDPNVTICREADALPVEVIVRGYITGSTSTSLWTLYEQGVERPYGLDLPEGLHKHAKLPEPVITPTTKGGPGEHDERLSSDEVVERGLVGADLWQEVQRTALALFARGSEIAAARGLILVDTKYELGLIGGKLIVIDEVHTPDSSRYWFAETYAGAMAAGEDPKALDKEFMRRWLKSQGYAGEGAPPAVPDDVLVECAQRYIETYEQLTGEQFQPGEQPAGPRIKAALEA